MRANGSPRCCARRSRARSDGGKRSRPPGRRNAASPRSAAAANPNAAAAASQVTSDVGCRPVSAFRFPSSVFRLPSFSEALMSTRTRRTFIKEAAAGAAGTAMLGSRAAAMSAASQDRVAGANRRVRVALIGCGGQGNGDLRAALRLGAECVALCDVDDEQTSKTRARIEKDFNAAPALMTRDFRRVLDRQDVDAVIIGTPDHWHALPTVLACDAGKDVYVEKPLALTIGEGRVMVNAARRRDRIVQMGTQQRSSAHYAEAIDFVKTG